MLEQDARINPKELFETHQRKTGQNEQGYVTNPRHEDGYGENIKNNIPQPKVEVPDALTQWSQPILRTPDGKAYDSNITSGIQVPNPRREPNAPTMYYDETVNYEERNLPRNQQSSLFEGEEIIGQSEGLIIETPTRKPQVRSNELSEERMGDIESWVADADSQIKEFEQKFGTLEEIEKRKIEQESVAKTDTEEADDTEEVKEFDEDKYNEALVIIDKTGMGVVNFTDEERLKLEKVKKIKVEEVETISLETLKMSKKKKYDIAKITKKKQSKLTTNIVLPASGYNAVVKGCSIYQLTTFFTDKANIVGDQLSKWEIVYNSIVSTSIPIKSFDEFLKVTAVDDLNQFIYGIICATYPDIDDFPLRCTKDTCPGTKVNGKSTTEYAHRYSVHSLIRAERLSEKLLTRLDEIIVASTTETDALAYHDASPVATSKVIKLPESDLIFELGVQSVYDFIYNSSRAADQLEEDKYQQALSTSIIVRRVLVEDEGEYIAVEDKFDIAQIIYDLSDIDLKILSKIGMEVSSDLSIEFGLVDIKCPYCKETTPFLPVDISSILFYKYRQATKTTID